MATQKMRVTEKGIRTNERDVWQHPTDGIAAGDGMLAVTAGRVLVTYIGAPLPCSDVVCPQR